MTTTGASATRAGTRDATTPASRSRNANVADTYYEVAGPGLGDQRPVLRPERDDGLRQVHLACHRHHLNPSNIQPGCTIDFTTCFPTATGRLDFGAIHGSERQLGRPVRQSAGPDQLDHRSSGRHPHLPTCRSPILATTIDLYYWSSAYRRSTPAMSRPTATSRCPPIISIPSCSSRCSSSTLQNNPISAMDATGHDQRRDRVRSERAASPQSSRRRLSRSSCPNPRRWPFGFGLAGSRFLAGASVNPSALT